jgi:hypothetical protein
LSVEPIRSSFSFSQAVTYAYYVTFFGYLQAIVNPIQFYRAGIMTLYSAQDMALLAIFANGNPRSLISSGSQIIVAVDGSMTQATFQAGLNQAVIIGFFYVNRAIIKKLTTVNQLRTGVR